MTTRAKSPSNNMKTELDVCLGKAGTPVGRLVFVRSGPRLFSQFALSCAQALNIVRELVTAVLQWRALGQSADVGMTTRELNEFAPAFEQASLLQTKDVGGF